jgi:type II secretory pathway component PulF
LELPALSFGLQKQCFFLLRYCVECASEDIDHQTKLLGTLMEPFIIILIGAVVGVIMVAMYLPMFNLSNVIQ